jgi:hypothetical protein
MYRSKIFKYEKNIKSAIQKMNFELLIQKFDQIDDEKNILLIKKNFEDDGFQIVSFHYFDWFPHIYYQNFTYSSWMNFNNTLVQVIIQILQDNKLLNREFEIFTINWNYDNELIKSNLNFNEFFFKWITQNNNIKLHFLTEMKQKKYQCDFCKFNLKTKIGNYLICNKNHPNIFHVECNNFRRIK